jgi:quaternary ammonium compound-resistance protein SugE
MAWVYILIAGLLEIGWIYSLKGMHGFTRLFPFIISYIACGFGAAYFLSLAMKQLPTGQSYAVWVGIGIAGSNLIGIIFQGEPWKISQSVCILMIIGGVVGLKLSASQ